MAIGAKKITLPIENESTGVVSNVEYTFVQTDTTLAVSGAAADAKKTGDEITALKQDYNQLSETKADKIANNPSMGAGYASQLVSSLRKSDSVPYNFRKVPYDATLEDGCIVGASVAWNQLVNNGDFSNGTANWLATRGEITVANNELTYSVTEVSTTTVGNRIRQKLSVVENHKYLVSFDVYTPKVAKVSCECTQPTAPHPWLSAFELNSVANSWVGYRTVVNSGATSDNNATIGLGLSYTQTAGYIIGDEIKFRNVMFFDLTQMLGTTIADYVYSLETATAGSGVAWLKEHFPKQFDSGYQAYNAGEIKSISGLSEHKSVGFNQWDEVAELGGVSNNTGNFYDATDRIRSKNYIPVLSSTVYYTNTQLGACAFYDANKNFVSGSAVSSGTFTTPGNAHYMRFATYSDYGTTYNHDICINISKPTGTPKNGDYVPYESHTYALDSSKTLRGILKLDSDNKLYADGDRYLADGTVERTWAEVDLGNLTWEQLDSENSSYFYSREFDNLIKENPDIICSKYNVVASVVGNSNILAVTDTGIIVKKATISGNPINIHDPAYTSASAFKTAMSGVKLIYPLATPTTETASPYGNPQVINPDGTESYVYADGAFELPVGHESEYPVNVSGQLDDILDTPTTNGTYTLQATVTDGAVSYEWVSTT